MRFLLLICISLLFAMGLVMIFSTTSAEVLDLDLSRSPHQAVLKQLSYAMAGFLAAVAVYRLGYRRLLQIAPQLFYIFIILLVIVLIPGIGREVNGSRRWLNLAGISFQPSEFVKYLMPLYFVARFLDAGQEPWTLLRFVKLVMLPMAAVVLILIEPNNGTAAVVGVTLVLLCLLTRLPFKFWGLPLLALAVGGALFAYHHPYISARINVYLHPELDLKGRGHQPYQAKIAVGSGGFLGRGPGNSLQKLSYLPEAQNDYIAAIYAEEFGFVGILFLVTLYGIVACIGYSIAIYSLDRQGFYLAAIVLFLICFQAFLNLGVVSGLLPSTGLNLPFFSQGGSSLIANMMGIALLLSIERERTLCNEKYS